MYEVKKIWKLFMSKSVGIGSSSYEKRIYRAAVSQTLRNTAIYGATATIAYTVLLLSMKCYL